MLTMSVGSTPVVRPDTKPDAARVAATGRWRATSPEYLSSQKPCRCAGTTTASARAAVQVAVHAVIS